MFVDRGRKPFDCHERSWLTFIWTAGLLCPFLHEVFLVFFLFPKAFVRLAMINAVVVVRNAAEFKVTTGVCLSLP